MSFTKRISAFLLVALMATQLLLAQHYSVHFNEKADACEICLLSKDMSHAVASAAVLVVAAVVAAIVFNIQAPRVVLQQAPRLFSARAPPTFLF